MHRRSVFAIALLGATHLFACTEGGDGITTSRSADLRFRADGGVSAASWFDRAAAYSCAVPRVRACSDGQLAAIVKTANEGEVQVAQSVVDRVSAPSVRELAQRLIDDHSRALEALDSVLAETGIEPVENDNTEEMKGATQSTIASLATKSGADLDASFVSHAVLDHLQDLGMIDHLLLPSAHDRQLARLIRSERVAIVSHLRMSTAIQAELSGRCGSDAPDEQDAGMDEEDVGAGEDAGM